MNAFFKNYIRPRFHRALFREGMRQLRLPGIVFAVWQALMMLMYAMDGNYSADGQKTYTAYIGVAYEMDEVVTIIALFSSLFLIGVLLYISRFLRYGKARDFYCSAPHSVGTVWLNFSLAAFAWNAVGIAAGHLVSTLVFLSNDLKLFALCVRALAGNLAFSFLIFGIVTLAITLTGRIVNTLVTGAGLAVLPTMLWYGFHAALDYYFSSFNFLRFPDGLRCPDPLSVFPYYLELTPNVFSFSIGGVPDGMELFCSGRTVLYCLCIGALWLAGAYLFGSIRTGDAVGRPFVNQAAHHVSLLSVTLPVTLWFVSFLPAVQTVFSSPYANQVTDIITAAAVCVVAYTVIYWVAELALTFDWKHAHRAFRYVPVPVALALAIVGTGYLATSFEFETTVKPEKVESFTLVRNSALDDDLAIFRLSGTYGRLVTDETRFTDREIIAYVSSQINDYVALYQESPKKAQRRTNNLAEEYSFDSGFTTDDGLGDNLSSINIQLTMKNGRKITRAVFFDDAHKKLLAKAIESDKPFMKQFLTLPDSSKLNIDLEGYDVLSGEEVEAIYKSFAAEYNEMTDARKLAFLKQNLYSDYNETPYEYDSYHEERSTTADGDAVVEDQPEEAGESEPEVTTAEEKSIRLVDKSFKVGDYYIENGDVSYGNYLTGSHGFNLTISGYSFGHLYQRDYSFEQTFRISPEEMPKTHALIIKTCNASIARMLQTLRDTDKLEDAYLAADYYTSTANWSVRYVWVTPDNLEMASVNVRDYLDAEYYESPWDEGKKFDGEVVEVDANALVDRLLNDAETTGDSIDFSKPYCVLNVSSWVYSKDRSLRDFDCIVFIQTDFSYEESSKQS